MKKLIAFMTCMILFACQKESTEVPSTQTPILIPEAAVLSFPKDKELCLSASKLNETYSDVSFEWQVAKNTNSYDVTVTNLNTNQSQTKYTTANKIDITLEAGVPYSWFVVSKSNSSNEKTNSTVWKFYLSGNGSANLAPYPADGLVPKSGASVGLVDGKATLSWVGQDPDSKTLSYEIFVDTDPAKVKNHEVTAIKTTTNTTSISLKSGQIYYWQIKTNDGNLSSFTQVFSFRTI
jgi:hypothetical protein